MPTRKEFRHFYETEEWFTIREKVKERAGDRCERCNAKNGAVGYFTLLGRFTEISFHSRYQAEQQGYKVITIQCGCAHRNNVPGDDRLENLVWLCRGCHLKMDKNHHRRSRQIRKDLGRPVLALVSMLLVLVAFSVERFASPAVEAIRGFCRA